MKTDANVSSKGEETWHRKMMLKALDAALAQIEEAVWKGLCDEAGRSRGEYAD